MKIKLSCKYELYTSDVGFMYRLNTENGGFTQDKSRGPKAPRDLSDAKPTFEVFDRLKT